jgi:YD repeat-containing protein
MNKSLFLILIFLIVPFTIFIRTESITSLSKVFSKKIFCFFFFSFFLTTAFSQGNGTKAPHDVPDVIPPSPTVASLMVVEDLPMDYYVGQPQISKPLFNKSVHGVNFSMGMTYSTAASKIFSRSSYIGTGWNLNVGGSVSRTIVEWPDELNSSNTNGIWDNPFESIDHNTTGDQRREFLWKAKGDSNENYDTHYDKYNFNVMGFTGSFIIKNENGILVPYLLDKNQNVKIIPNYTIRPGLNEKIINSFEIIDAMGYHYFFEEVEQTWNQNSSISIHQENSSGADNTNVGQGINYGVNSAWNITRIENSNGISLADFYYKAASDESYTASVSETRNEIIDSPLQGDMISNPYNYQVLRPRFSTSYNLVTISTKKLDYIKFSGQDYEIQFNYRTEMHPETGGKILSYIDYVDKSLVQDNNIKSWFFNTSIVNGRLWLDSIIEKGGLIDEQTQYSYVSKDLPAPDELSSYDDWGYPKMNTEVINDLHTEAYVANGILDKITYPTGGQQVLSWEPNTISWYGDEEITNFSKNPMNLSDLESNFLINASNVPSNQFPTIGSFILDFSQKVNVSALLQGSDSSGSNNLVLADFNLTLTNSISGSFRSIHLDDLPYDFDLPAGNYTCEVNYTGTIINPNATVWASGLIRFEYAEFASEIQPYIYGAGARIANISVFNADRQIIPQKSFDIIYHEEDNNLTDNLTERSHGTIDGIEGSIRRGYQDAQDYFLFNNSFDLGVEGMPNFYNIKFNVTTTSSNYYLTSAFHVGYKNVRFLRQGLGYTENHYTSPFTYPSSDGTFIYPYRPEPNLGFKRGKLIKSEVINEVGDILLETINDYDFSEEIVAKSMEINAIPGLIFQFFDQYHAFNTNVPDKPIPSHVGVSHPPTSIYLQANAIGGNYVSYVDGFIHSNWSKLIKTTSRKYFYEDNGLSNSVETVKNIQYSDFNFLPSVETITNSKGETIRTEILYPDRYSETGFNSSNQFVLQNMLAANVINTPILKRTSIISSGSGRSSEQLSKVSTIYNEFESNQFLPVTVSTQKSVTDPMEPRLTYHDYDEYGNVLDVSKQDGTHVSYIYGYNKTLPIAKIEGRTYADVITALGISSPNETHMTNINNLRNTFSVTDPFMITTYEYEIGIGIKKVTDPRGRTMTYYYDDFNRLEYVTDHDGNMLSKNEYKYATQN